MAKILQLDMNNEEELCDVGKALSSPIRIEMLKLLYYNSLNIGEISEELNIAASSAALHVKILEKANLINTEVQPGARGTMKLCSRKSDVVNLRLAAIPRDVNEIVSVNMPVGAYTDCEIVPTCGLADCEGIIGSEDSKSMFFAPERLSAQLIWSSGGYVEYKFPNPLPRDKKAKRLLLSMEICSEAPNYREDWKSDITVWMNGIDCGVWRAPGDFGSRRGRLNPVKWESGNTQYGLLTTWEVREDGSYVNEVRTGNSDISQLQVTDKEYIAVRIGNRKDAKYMGGFNIFGEKFGDYSQSIVLSIEY